MSEVMEHLAAHLDDARIREIASYLGADPQQVEQAISVAVPTLIGAMGKAAESEQGAHALSHQMQALGGGSLGDLLGGLLSSSQEDPQASRNSIPVPDLSNLTRNLPKSSQSADAALDDALNGVRGGGATATANREAPSSSLGDVLGGVLGGKQKKVEDAIGRSSGLSLSKVGPLLVILGPIVLSALRSRTQASSGSSGKIDPSDLTNILRKESQSMDKHRTGGGAGVGGAGGGLLSSFLDQDGDGDFDLSDILKLGARFLFKRS